ncbi:MAG: hypothetical protein KC800_25245 [Candidatus Eremiobacteraeota bacterium]|nr:hypothetical protein [Candidatus Eremiobacteraeota bacterium]
MLLPGIGGKIIGAALDKKKSKKSDKMMQAKIMQLEQRSVARFVTGQCRVEAVARYRGREYFGRSDLVEILP